MRSIRFDAARVCVRLAPALAAAGLFVGGCSEAQNAEGTAAGGVSAQEGPAGSAGANAGPSSGSSSGGSAVTAGAAGVVAATAGLAGGGAQGGGGLHGDAGGGPMAGTAGQAGSTGSELCPPQAQVCETFESGTLADLKSGLKQEDSGGSAVIDTAHASHGLKSLRVSATASGSSKGSLLAAHGAPLFPLPGGELWGRVMVFYEQPPVGHTDMVLLGGKTKSGSLYHLAGQTESGKSDANIMLSYSNSSGADCWAHPSPRQLIPPKTWMCWEWHVSSKTGVIDFWYDGKPSRSVDGAGEGCSGGKTVTWAAPESFEGAWIGADIFDRSSQKGPLSAWVDDIALSNQSRIGCPEEGSGK